jgi:hypothetical protein
VKIYLAGTRVVRKVYEKNTFPQNICILESFYYVENWMIPYIRNHWDFMLDSGAFTFIQNGKHSNINWDAYLEKYAQFIIENNVKLFYELDIDKIVGINEVERLRLKLESIVGRQCIPVWHVNRGKNYWLRMVDEYNYVAFGAVLTDGVGARKVKSIIPWFGREAHKHKCMMHVLGFTPKDLNVFSGFIDSVDSTSWTMGNRVGYVDVFRNGRMQQTYSPDNMKLKTKVVRFHNFREWIKYQQYAKENL